VFEKEKGKGVSGILFLLFQHLHLGLKKKEKKEMKKRERKKALDVVRAIWENCRKKKKKYKKGEEEGEGGHRVNYTMNPSGFAHGSPPARLGERKHRRGKKKKRGQDVHSIINRISITALLWPKSLRQGKEERGKGIEGKGKRGGPRPFFQYSVWATVNLAEKGERKAERRGGKRIPITISCEVTI